MYERLVVSVFPDSRFRRVTISRSAMRSGVRSLGAIKVERRHNKDLVAVCVHFFHLFLRSYRDRASLHIIVCIVVFDTDIHRKSRSRSKHVDVVVALVNG